MLGGEVTALVAGPAASVLYAAAGRRVTVLDPATCSVLKSFTVVETGAGEAGNTVSHLAVAGVGLWVALAGSPTVSLYHTESFIHMQVGIILT